MSWTYPGHYKVHVHGWDVQDCPIPLPALPRVIFVDDCASSYMIVVTVANSWFTQDPANVTRFGSSYAEHKLLTKSIKKGFDTILKEILQHTNNHVRA